MAPPAACARLLACSSIGRYASGSVSAHARERVTRPLGY